MLVRETGLRDGERVPFLELGYWRIMNGRVRKWLLNGHASKVPARNPGRTIFMDG